VTGRGLAANIRRAYAPWLLYSIVILLLVANVINIAADIAAMGEAMRLVTGIGRPCVFARLRPAVPVAAVILPTPAMCAT